MTTYTYSGDPLNVPLDEVRMLLSDMGTSDNNTDGAPENSKFGCLVTDEVINYHISKVPDNVYRVCQIILQLVITGLQGGNERYKTLLSQKTGDLSENYGNTAADSMYVVEALIRDLRAQELAMLGSVDADMGYKDTELHEGFDHTKMLDITACPGYIGL